MTMPDFLCIGAQKSGTSWLDTNIRVHPKVWMPPVKELHYFDRHLSPYIMDLFDSDPQIRRRLLLRLRRLLRDLAGSTTRPGKFFKKLSWYLRFILMFRSDQWYVSLFSPGAEQIAGDVTPAYARLPDKAVARVHALMPEAKIIYLLRNPIERMWSEASMYFSTNGCAGIHTIAAEEVRRFFDQAATTANSTYMTTLRRWQQFYPNERIFVGFFEQLSQCPQKLLTDIFEFLELPDARAHIPETVYCKVNARSYPPPPDHVARDLAPRFYDEITQLHQAFPNDYTQRWLTFAARHMPSERE